MHTSDSGKPRRCASSNQALSDVCGEEEIILVMRVGTPEEVQVITRKHAEIDPEVVLEQWTDVTLRTSPGVDQWHP